MPAIPVPPLSFALALGVGAARGRHRHPRADAADAGARRGAGARADPHPGLHHRGGRRAADAGAHRGRLPAPAPRRRARAASCPARGRRRGRRGRHGDRPEAGADRLDARRVARARGRRPARRVGARRLDAEHLDEPAARLAGAGHALRARREPVHRPRPRPPPARRRVRRSTTSRATAIGRTSRCSRSTGSRARCGAPPSAPSTATTPSTRCRAPTGLSGGSQTSEHPIDVIVDEVRTTWLPVPYPTTRIDGLRGSWFWEDGSLTVRSVDTNTAGQRYRVDPPRRRADARAAPQRRPPTSPRSSHRSSRCPRSCPQIITDTAASVTVGRRVAVRRGGRDPGVPARRRLRLLDRGARRGGLRRRRVRRHRAVPRDEGRLLRALRLDDGGARARGRASRRASRSATRRARPTEERVDGVQRVEVDSHDLHSWPELYFEGVGWVPFEPTPGRGHRARLLASRRRRGAGHRTCPARRPPRRARAAAPTSTPTAASPARAATRSRPPASWWLRGGADRARRAAPAAPAPAALRSSQRLDATRGASAAASGRRMPRGTSSWRPRATSARAAATPRPPRAFAARIAEREAFADDAAARAALLRLRDAVERERYGPTRARRRRPAARSSDLALARDGARSPMPAPSERARAVLDAAFAVRPGAQGARRPPSAPGA